MWTSDNGVAPAYNVQITADASQGLIADVEVVNDPQTSPFGTPLAATPAVECWLSCCVPAITPIRGFGEGTVAKIDAVKTEVSQRGTDFLTLVKKIRESKPRSRDLAALRRELARDPDLWRRFGDLSTASIGLVIDDAVSSLAPGDQAVLRESMKAGQQQMRAALGYESSPPLERLLVDQVCLCWLRLSCMELYLH